MMDIKTYCLMWFLKERKVTGESPDGLYTFAKISVLAGSVHTIISIVLCNKFKNKPLNESMSI